jgi:plasmid stabilization system protein ParE
MIRLKYHFDAEVKFDEAVEFYDEKGFGLGERFQKAVFHAVERIRQNPQTGMIWIQETRLFIVNRFPYGIVFKNLTDYIFIVAIYHLSREPDYWTKMLQD